MILKKLCLFCSTGDAVEQQQVGVGLIAAKRFMLVDRFSPYFDGEFIGNQFAVFVPDVFVVFLIVFEPHSVSVLIHLVFGFVINDGLYHGNGRRIERRFHSSYLPYCHGDFWNGGNGHVLFA